MQIIATFTGTKSLGYVNGKKYKLNIYDDGRCIYIEREDKTGLCPYTSVTAFLKNWDNIKQAHYQAYEWQIFIDEAQPILNQYKNEVISGGKAVEEINAIINRTSKQEISILGALIDKLTQLKKDNLLTYFLDKYDPLVRLLKQLLTE